MELPQWSSVLRESLGPGSLNNILCPKWNLGVCQQVHQAMRSLKSPLPGLWDWPTESEDTWSLYQAVGIGQANVVVTNNLKVFATQPNKSVFLIPSICQWALSELFLPCELGSALSVVTGAAGLQGGNGEH